MEGGEQIVRVKFDLDRVGDFVMGEIPDELVSLVQLAAELEELDAIPIFGDGKVAGNCGFSDKILHHKLDSTGGTFFVSKTGKSPIKLLTGEDFVQIIKFDIENWSAQFKSCNPQTEPTSDLPLYESIFNEQNFDRLGWFSIPKIAIHGHALATKKEAEEAGIPISEKTTLFSTLEDKIELEELFKEYPYPTNKCYVRLGHGFFILGDSVEDVRQSYEKKIKPNLVRKWMQEHKRNEP